MFTLYRCMFSHETARKIAMSGGVVTQMTKEYITYLHRAAQTENCQPV